MKKKVTLLVNLLIMFVFIPKYNAECKDEYIINEGNVVQTYFVSQTAIDEEQDKVKLVISDISDDLFIVVTNDTTDERKTYKDIENGVISIDTPSPIRQYNYTVRIYSNAYECPNELLKKVELTSLAYNMWTESSECKELYDELQSKANFERIEGPDFCKSYTSKIYSDLEFKKAYTEYKRKLNEPTLQEKITQKFYKYYYFAIIPIVLLTIYYIIRLKKIRNRKKAQNEE